MKLNSKTLFVLIICVTSCFFEGEDCEDHYYANLSEEEMLFIPYRQNDSILFKDNLDKSYFLTVEKENVCNACSTWFYDDYCKNGGYYHIDYFVDISLNSNIPVLKNDQLAINLWLNRMNKAYLDFDYLFKPEGLTDFNSNIGKEYNGKIFVTHKYKFYSDSNKLEFYNNNLFVKPDPQVLYFPSYSLGEREFKNSYVIIESKEFGFFDTIVYAPKYGFIKFTDDTLSYSYINKYEH